MSHSQYVAVGCLAFILASKASSLAWPRGPIADKDVVTRAELIVVGRIQPSSIKRVDHLGEPGSYEHHATLVVAETLKGKSKETIIPIIIHYGLLPVTGRYINARGYSFDHRAYKPSAAKDAIEIYDYGGGLDRRISGDIRDPQIWILRKNPGYETPESTASPGIWDPEDIQPLAKKEALKKWITP